MKSRIDSSCVSNFTKDIYDAVELYLAARDELAGSTELQINDEDYSVALGSVNDPLPNCDYFDLEKLIVETPEGLIPDDDTIAALAAGYYVNS